MADSRRINANIREEDEKRPADEQPPFGVYAVILSSEFWPPFKDEKLEVPEDIREALEVYCKKYEKLKVLPPPCGTTALLRLSPAAPEQLGAVHMQAPPGVLWGLHTGTEGPPVLCSPGTCACPCVTCAVLTALTLWAFSSTVHSLASQNQGLGGGIGPRESGCVCSGHMPRSCLWEVCRLLWRRLTSVTLPCLAPADTPGSRFPELRVLGTRTILPTVWSLGVWGWARRRQTGGADWPG